MSSNQASDEEQSKYIYTPNFIFEPNNNKVKKGEKKPGNHFKNYFDLARGWLLCSISDVIFLVMMMLRKTFLILISVLIWIKEFVLGLKNLKNKHSRLIWSLNWKVNKIIWTKTLLEIWQMISTVSRTSYLAILIISMSLGLRYVASNNTVQKGDKNSFLSRFMAKYSLVDTSINNIPANFAAITTSAKKLEDTARLIKHKTIAGDTINKIADKYGLLPDTVAINNRLLEFDKNKELELDKDLYLPWQNSYIYLAKEDTEPKKLVDLFKVNENKLYSDNESIFDPITAKFPKDKLVLIPTENFEEATKYEKLLIVKETLGSSGAKLSEEKIQKIAENYAADATSLSQYASSRSNQTSSGFIWPTTGTISRCIEYNHPGCDIANNSNPPVYAVADAVVTDVYRYTVWGYGLAVVLKHSNGLVTLYAHLNDIYVSPGQIVTQGQAIGQMGSTGNSTGTHLHFEVRSGGSTQNPLDYLPGNVPN